MTFTYPFDVFCPHGLDLRVHPRCYLCDPLRQVVTSPNTYPIPTTSPNVYPADPAPWCSVCRRYHFQSVMPCIKITYG